MDQREKMALQVAKEIVVKFIEIGRISPGNFPEFFSTIYKEILDTVSREEQSPPEEKEEK